MKKYFWWLVATVFIILLVVVLYVRSLYIKSATDTVAFFQPGTGLQNLFLDKERSTTSSIRVVYFWQGDCPCDAFVKAHFLLMLKHYQQQAKQTIDFYLAPVNNKNSVKDNDFSQVQVFPSAWLDKVREEILATPSVAIWNTEGELVYFGPHSMGYLCNDETSLVKKVIDALLANQPFSALSVVGDGCFCDVDG